MSDLGQPTNDGDLYVPDGYERQSESENVFLIADGEVIDPGFTGLWETPGAINHGLLLVSSEQISQDEYRLLINSIVPNQVLEQIGFEGVFDSYVQFKKDCNDTAFAIETALIDQELITPRDTAMQFERIQFMAALRMFQIGFEEDNAVRNVYGGMTCYIGHEELDLDQFHGDELQEYRVDLPARQAMILVGGYTRFTELYGQPEEGQNYSVEMVRFAGNSRGEVVGPYGELGFTRYIDNNGDQEVLDIASELTQNYLNSLVNNPEDLFGTFVTGSSFSPQIFTIGDTGITILRNESLPSRDFVDLQAETIQDVTRMLDANNLQYRIENNGNGDVVLVLPAVDRDHYVQFNADGLSYNSIYIGDLDAIPFNMSETYEHFEDNGFVYAMAILLTISTLISGAKYGGKAIDAVKLINGDLRKRYAFHTLGRLDLQQVFEPSGAMDIETFKKTHRMLKILENLEVDQIQARLDDLDNSGIGRSSKKLASTIKNKSARTKLIATYGDSISDDEHFESFVEEYGALGNGVRVPFSRNRAQYKVAKNNASTVTAEDPERNSKKPERPKSSKKRRKTVKNDDDNREENIAQSPQELARQARNEATWGGDFNDSVGNLSKRKVFDKVQEVIAKQLSRRDGVNSGSYGTASIDGNNYLMFSAGNVHTKGDRVMFFYDNVNNKIIMGKYFSSNEHDKAYTDYYRSFQEQ